MKLIVGLGNPGKDYAGSRHNIGFLVIKALAKSCKIPFKKDTATFSLNALVKIDGQNVILAMPLTFMNLSGMAVSALFKKYKIGPDNLLVVCDDLDLGLPRLRIRALGSSGGHRGLKSVIDALGTKGFSRLRIGIGRPENINIEASEYVLSPFNREEKGQVEKAIERARQCCSIWVTKGVTEAMNIFNKRSRDE